MEFKDQIKRKISILKGRGPLKTVKLWPEIQSLRSLSINTIIALAVNPNELGDLPTHLLLAIIIKLQEAKATAEVNERTATEECQAWYGHIPLADASLGNYDIRRAANEYDEDGNFNDVYEPRNRICKQWTWGLPDYPMEVLRRGKLERRNVDWNALDLQLNSNGHIGTCPFARSKCHEISGTRYCDEGRGLLLFGCISSQLLLYRLMTIFGMPPQEDGDGYKVCWSTMLVHHDGVSYLRVHDYKGGPSVHFDGTPEASNDAIVMLEYLISEKCYHSYDGVLAGTVE